MTKNLFQRLATGILGSAVFIFMLVFNYYTFTFIIGLMLVLVLLEFYQMAQKYTPSKWMGTFVGLYIYGIVFLHNANMLNTKLIALAILLFMSIPIVLLFQKQRNLIHSLAITYFGVLYIALPSALLLLVSKSNLDSMDQGYNRYFLLAIFLIIWSNDTGAYFSGKLMGKTKLFERVSPNKTVEGSIGGVALAFIIIAIYVQCIAKTDYPIYFWAILTLLISISGIFGDLIESQMKRNLGVKDSGSFLPGHGGFLDRFDALIFALPFAYIAFLCL